MPERSFPENQAADGSIAVGNTAVDMEPKRLFVYGSLMEGFFNYKKVLEGKVITRVPAIARGILYHQCKKGYPAMIPGEGRVRGEFLELDNYESLITLCDNLEMYLGPGHPGNEYERRAEVVELETGETRPAWVYWYARSDLNSPENPVVLIPSGDWRKFIPS